METSEESFSIDTFHRHLAGVFDPGTTEPLKEDVRFQDLEKWDSIASVSIVAMIYAEYDVQISGDELVSCETVDQLTNIVRGKLAE